MPDPFVRELGRVEDIDGAALAVGVDYDTVSIGGHRLASAQLEEFARLFTAAHWQAAANTVAAALTRDRLDG
jgi:predicted alpha/beta-hydrolase family hydrolase